MYLYHFCAWNQIYCKVYLQWVIVIALIASCSATVSTICFGSLDLSSPDLFCRYFSCNRFASIGIVIVDVMVVFAVHIFLSPWMAGVVLAVGMAAQIVAEFSSSNVAFKIGHWKCVLIAYFLLSAGMMSVSTFLPISDLFWQNQGNVVFIYCQKYHINFKTPHGVLKYVNHNRGKLCLQLNPYISRNNQTRTMVQSSLERREMHACNEAMVR